ncbi:hypothetical protein [Winogradskyella pulchriflava]|uniref:Uncharacterized protein n=1 Tax=Winogradskyella pulchriflava TaxID=1110688 RepID=A0ABV6Q9V3_9FLAO
MTTLLFIISIISISFYISFVTDFNTSLYFNTYKKSILDVIGFSKNVEESISPIALSAIQNNDDQGYINEFDLRMAKNKLGKNLKTLNYLYLLEFNSKSLLCPDRMEEIQELKENLQREVIRNTALISNSKIS